MSRILRVKSPLKYSAVGGISIIQRPIFRHFFQLIVTAMERRLVMSALMLLYYVIELSVLFAQEELMFLKVIVEIMLVLSCLAIARIYVRDCEALNTLLVIDGCLFGLTVGWLCFASFGIQGDVGICVFFAINSAVLFLLVLLDVKAQKGRVSPISMQGDTSNKVTVNGNNETGGNGVEKNGSTHNIYNHNVASSDPNGRYLHNKSDPNDRYLHNKSDLEGGSGTNNNIDIGQPSFGSIFDGFRVRLEKLPTNNQINDEVPWESFSYVEHRVDSSSCHIYSAFWRGTAVIIKLIKADRVSSPMALAEFETEACVLSRLDHPHIVKLLGSGRYPRRFLILELLDGGSLSHSLGIRSGSNNRITKKKFSYLDTLLLARSLASALDYLHHQWHTGIHVIHRDLKPDNIGFTADGKLKLFDFGLCVCVRTQVNRKDQYRLTGNTGTLRYMAPEVALGRQYNSSVDVYSFGVILWQVLRSRLPFRDMGKKTYMQEVVVGGRRPPLDRRWPKGFSALLQKCWHEDKDSRPTFSQVVTDLDLLLEETSGRSSVGIAMQVTHKMRYVKSFAMTNLLRFRTIISAIAIALVLVAIVVLRFGDRVSGSSLAVVSCTTLYLAGMSLVTSKVGDMQQDSKNGSSAKELFESKVHHFFRYFGRETRSAPSPSILELKRYPVDPHAQPVPSHSETSIDAGPDDTTSFDMMFHDSSRGRKEEGTI
jgi:serine/threonine protein kinase